MKIPLAVNAAVWYSLVITENAVTVHQDGAKSKLQNIESNFNNTIGNNMKATKLRIYKHEYSIKRIVKNALGIRWYDLYNGEYK